MEKILTCNSWINALFMANCDKGSKVSNSFLLMSLTFLLGRTSQCILSHSLIRLTIENAVIKTIELKTSKKVVSPLTRLVQLTMQLSETDAYSQWTIVTMQLGVDIILWPLTCLMGVAERLGHACSHTWGPAVLLKMTVHSAYELRVTINTASEQLQISCHI